MRWLMIIVARGWFVETERAQGTQANEGLVQCDDPVRSFSASPVDGIPQARCHLPTIQKSSRV